MPSPPLPPPSPPSAPPPPTHDPFTYPPFRPSQSHHEIRAPFELQPTPSYQQGLVFHKNAWKTPNQVVAESNAESSTRPVVDAFPVSTGVDHQKQEDKQDAQRASDAINVFAKFQVCVNVRTDKFHSASKMTVRMQ